jgi:DNA polymerase-1
LAKVLIEDLGAPKTKKIKTGYSMDASALEDLLDSENLTSRARDLIRLVLEHREFSKLKSTYADSIPALVNNRTGKLHTYFNQSGTSTGRLSSSDPNLQNIPVRTETGNEVRKAFEAKEGHVLMSADYSQIELKILAHLSEEPGLLKAFINNEDIHDATAKTIYQTNIVNKEQRRVAKILNFGVIYGLSAHGVSRQTDLTRLQGKEFIDLYFGKYPGIKKYIDNVVEFAKKNKFVETLTKRRRLIPEINSPNYQLRSSSERMAINMPIQGSAADVIKISMIQINKKIQELSMKSKMIIQVHDELIFEVPEQEIFQMESILKEIMPEALNLKVPLTIAVSYEKTWGDLK